MKVLLVGYDVDDLGWDYGDLFGSESMRLEGGILLGAESGEG